VCRGVEPRLCWARCARRSAGWSLGTDTWVGTDASVGTLGRAGPLTYTQVEMEFERSTTQNKKPEQYSVSLVRSSASTKASVANDVLLDEAYREIQRLTAEVDHAAVEKAHLQITHSQELEEYRVQVRELRERQLSLTVEHHQELQRQRSELDAAREEADTLRRQLHAQEQIEATSLWLKQQKNELAREVQKLAADKEQLQREKQQLLNSTYL